MYVYCSPIVVGLVAYNINIIYVQRRYLIFFLYNPIGLNWAVIYRTHQNTTFHVYAAYTVQLHVIKIKKAPHAIKIEITIYTQLILTIIIAVVVVVAVAGSCATYT